MKKKTLRQINMNIETTKELISGYEDKLEKLKLSVIKPSHVYLCGTFGGIISMVSVGEPSLDLMIFAGMSGYVVGSAIPYVVKKVRIADLNYQIYVNNSIVSDLENEKSEFENNSNYMKKKII